MLSLDLDNLHKISQINSQNGVSKEDLDNWSNKYSHYNDLVISRKQGFLDLPKDLEIIKKIETYSKSIQGKYKYLIILGIGGSMLGPQVILQALDTPQARKNRGFTQDLQVFCVDNSDPFLISEIAGQIEIAKTLVLVQTKSGGTPETLAQYLYFKEIAEKANLSLKNHFVFVTDPEVGYLRKLATSLDIPSFEVPPNVGGRFSVLSSIGLVLAGILGLDLHKMLAGANDVNFVAAFNMSVCQYELSKKGKNITVLMPYSSRLKTLSNWYVQLLSESVGKEFNLENKKVNVGLTPVPALGATDQHSQLQLFKEGPDDKLIIFLSVKDYQAKTTIPEDENFPYLANRSFEDLIKAEFLGTRQSILESEKANLTLEIDKVDEYSLAQLFMFLQLNVAYLGEMFGINTFDQPGVERSKVLTKEILETNN
jgi:glucose-6-phosphate isomerase